MNLIRIEAPEDPRLVAYRCIRERDLVGREGRFIAEGRVVVTALLASSFQVESLLLLDRRLEGLAAALGRAAPGLPVYLASQQIVDSIAGFHLHRGILAVGLRGIARTADELMAALPERALVIVLVGIANHDNVGSIFRNAAAFGATAVLLDATCCNPLYRKALRVSVGAVLSTPFAAMSAEEISPLLRSHGFDEVGLSPAGITDIARLRRSARMALYLGSEGEGLPKPLLGRLRTVRIAMAPGFDSLNVAAASAIALHRLSEL